MKILVLDSVTRHLVNVFERNIAPEIPTDIQVDYVQGWEKGLRMFKDYPYDMVVIESIVARREIEISPKTKSLLVKIKDACKRLGKPVVGTVDIPGFTGQASGSLLIGAEKCIQQMQTIRPQTKYIVSNHLRSGYSKENRQRLNEMENIIGVFNNLLSKGIKLKILKLIQKCAAEIQ